MRMHTIGEYRIGDFDDGNMLVAKVKKEEGGKENCSAAAMMSGMHRHENAKKLACSDMLRAALTEALGALTKMQAFTAMGPYADGDMYVRITEALEISDPLVTIAETAARFKPSVPLQRAPVQAPAPVVMTPLQRMEQAMLGPATASA